MKSAKSIYPLRLPRSLKAEVQRRAKDDLVSMNQFVAIAVAEKLAAMSSAAYFAEKRELADFDAFDRIMGRDAAEPPPPSEDVIL
jgi:hypothetical protein